MAPLPRVSVAWVHGFCALFDNFGWEISETTGTEPTKSKPGFRYFCAGPLEHGGAVQVNFSVGPDGVVSTDTKFEMVAPNALDEAEGVF